MIRSIIMVRITAEQRNKMKEMMADTLRVYIKVLQLAEDNELTIEVLQDAYDVLQRDIKTSIMSSLEKVDYIDGLLRDIAKGDDK